MKKTLLCWVFTALLLSSCSLLERSPEPAEDPSAPPFEPSENIETADTQIDPTGSMKSTPGLESEVSRLNTKISALETKLDVLSASMERNQLQRGQPVIEAQSAPEPNMAAPVEEEESAAPQVSAAPVRATALPVSVKHSDGATGGSEKEFRAAMELFQSGKNLESASRFALYAKKYPRHLLASHALYWAGEASARAQQWSLALENWEELERAYPRSAYLPEALAGLSRVYEKQGDPMKAKAYRDTLVRAFPKSPVVLSLRGSSEAAAPASPRAASHAPVSEEIPAYEEENSREEGTSE